MNKVSIIIFLFLGTFIYSQTYYYACNENYIIQNTILESDVENYEYYIVLKIIDNMQTYIYYKNNEIQKKIIITVDGNIKKEEEWETELLIAERTYMSNRLIHEIVYSKTSATYEKHEYIYNDDLLEKIIITDQNNKLYTIDYIYDQGKRIRAISINKKIISFSQFNSASIITRWNQDIFSIEIYNAQMLLQYLYSYAGSGALVIEEERLYQDSQLIKIIQKNYQKNQERVIIYDNSLIVEEQTINLQKKNIIETIQYLYNDEKLLQKKIILMPKDTIVFEYTYNEKKLYEEKQYINGVYKQYKKWLSDSSYVIEIYEDNGITIIITYINEKKVKEVVMLNTVTLYEKVYE